MSKDTAKNKALGTLGLAMKAGQVVSGEFAVEKAVREEKARLVLIASDASGGTKKKFMDSCRYHKVPFAVYADKDTLGRAIGKRMRATVAILDENLADAVVKNIDGEVNGYGKDENL